MTDNIEEQLEKEMKFKLESRDIRIATLDLPGDEEARQAAAKLYLASRDSEVTQCWVDCLGWLRSRIEGGGR